MMIKSLMRKQNVMSLDAMFEEAAALGIEITVCEMSMNLMGFKREEMIDYPHLRFAGATTLWPTQREQHAVANLKSEKHESRRFKRVICDSFGGCTVLSMSGSSFGGQESHGYHLYG